MNAEQTRNGNSDSHGNVLEPIVFHQRTRGLNIDSGTRMGKIVAAGNGADPPLTGIVHRIPAVFIPDQRTGDKILLNGGKLLQSAFFPADNGIRESLFQNGKSITFLLRKTFDLCDCQSLPGLSGNKGQRIAGHGMSGHGRIERRVSLGINDVFAADKYIEAVVARILHGTAGKVGSVARNQEIRVGGKTKTGKRIQFAFRPRIPESAPGLERSRRRVADVNILGCAENAVSRRETGELAFPVRNHELQTRTDEPDRIPLVHVNPILPVSERIGLFLVVNQELRAHQFSIGRIRRTALEARIVFVNRIIRSQSTGIMLNRNRVRGNIHGKNGSLTERSLPVLQHQIADRHIPAGIHIQSHSTRTAEKQFSRLGTLSFDQRIFQPGQPHMTPAFRCRLPFRRNKTVEEINSRRNPQNRRRSIELFHRVQSPDKCGTVIGDPIALCPELFHIEHLRVVPRIFPFRKPREFADAFRFELEVIDKTFHILNSVCRVQKTGQIPCLEIPANEAFQILDNLHPFPDPLLLKTVPSFQTALHHSAIPIDLRSVFFELNGNLLPQFLLPLLRNSVVRERRQ